MYAEYSSKVIQDDMLSFEDSEDDASNNVQSYLYVHDIESINDNCEGPITVVCERNTNGLWDPLNIWCTYETKASVWYLKVCLLDFKKIYMYKLDYDIEKYPEWAEYFITFDLNAAVSHKKTTTVYVFTCHPDCEWNPEGCTLEKMTVIEP